MASAVLNSANVFVGLCLAVTYRNLKSGSRAPSGSFRLINATAPCWLALGFMGPPGKWHI